MTIQLNGKSKEFDSPLTILQLLESLGLSPQRVAVEHNREIIKRERYAEVTLEDGDEVEVLQFVGGGAPDTTTR